MEGVEVSHWRGRSFWKQAERGKKRWVYLLKKYTGATNTEISVQLLSNEFARRQNGNGLG
jgi:hypothetical protein